MATRQHSSGTKRWDRTWVRNLKFTAIIAAIVVSLAYAAGCGSDRPPDNVQTEPTDIEPIPDTATFVFPEGDYSKFDHGSEQHARMPCLVCHTREDNSAQMKFSGHIPCASCHVEHFSNTKHSICSICHTDAESGAMKNFPTLASFSTRFDHGKHLPHSNCADCHRPARGGATFSVPTRANSHTTCFQCHKPEAEFEGRDLASCSVCHEEGSPGPRRGGIRAQGGNFSHAAHGPRQRLNCNSCHTVQAAMPRGRQVVSPRTAMHFSTGRAQSCATCHDGKRAFGGEDFASCSRCHTGPSFRF
jgi:c(7)-type cytochrome triheme protein